MSKPPDDTMLKAALKYAERGWQVFPADLSNGERKSHKSAKHSNGRRWGATSDPEEIRRDFARWPNAGIGIATGRESKLLILDADTLAGHGVDGLNSLQRLEVIHGSLPPTLRATTPTNGQHHYFSYPDDGTVIQSSIGKVAPGIDIIAESHMVLAPPTVRPGVGAYRWVNSYAPIARAPGWLVVAAGGSAGPDDRESNPDLQTEPEILAAALAVVPNKAIVFDENAPPDQDATWEHWNNVIGLGCFGATGGTDEGLAAWDAWSRESKKYNENTTRERWGNFKRSPPGRIGAGTIIYLADEADPGWRNRYDAALQAKMDAAADADDEAAAELRAALGHRDTPGNGNASGGSAGGDETPRRAAPATKVSSPIRATPYVCRDPTTIPRRQWLYKPSYIRQFTSMNVATSKVGKSSLLIVEALAMTSHRALLGVMPSAPLRVWYWNGEDPREEIERRIEAARKYYGLTPEDIGDRLFVDSGRVMPIVIAETSGRQGTRIAVPVVDGVIAALRDNGIDALIIDPFVSSHRVTENDNNAIDLVAKKWAHIAEVANCAVRYAHHTRKTGGEAVTGEDQRGASANFAAVRYVDALNYMTELEAGNAGIAPVRRKFYFRQDEESNLLPPAETSRWFEKVSVDLLNAPHPEDSDRVGVVVPWVYPVAHEIKATSDAEERILAALQKQEWWREDHQSNDWVGKAVASVLGIAVEGKANKANRRRVTEYVKDMVTRGLLRREPRKVRGKEDVACVTARVPTLF